MEFLVREFVPFLFNIRKNSSGHFEAMNEVVLVRLLINMQQQQMNLGE